MDDSDSLQYHECGFCQTIVLDTSARLHAETRRRAFPDIYFLGPTLSEVLAARSRCALAGWLLDAWAESSDIDSADWDYLRSRSDRVLLCARLKYWDRISWVGMWDSDLEGLVEPAALNQDDDDDDLLDHANDDDDEDDHDGWLCPVIRSERTLSSYVPEDDPHAAEGLLSRPVNLHPGSQATFARIKEWMAECLEHHDDCVGRSHDFMPDALLKVSWSEQTSAYDVSLHFPRGEKAPYLALSYCWGGDQPYKTTQARIRSQQFQLEWTLLPATIRDAIRVTVGLGFNHLWVDSLCIVQDELQAHKAKQIAQMPQIYSNAVVTLAASKSVRADDGFLDEVHIASMTRLAVKLRYADRKNSMSGSIFVVEFTGESNMEPLDLRGWTFQERHLSTRMVDFDARCVYWSCLTEPPGRLRDGWGLFKPKSNSSKLRAWYALRRLHDADKPASDALGRRSSTSSSSSAASRGRRDACEGTSYYQTVLEEFYSVVADYTERILSIPQDRILAVSGMAEMFGPILDDDYAAGLWRRSLPSSLLWNISRDGRDLHGDPSFVADVGLRRRPERFQAPSWSWAAVNGRVSSFHQTLELRPVVSDVDVRVELVEPTARYGACMWGRLSGSAPIRRAVWLGRRSWRRADLYALHVLDDASPSARDGGGWSQLFAGSQVTGGSQVAAAGGSQLLGASQLLGGSQLFGASQLAGASQLLGGSQIGVVLDDDAGPLTCTEIPLLRMIPDAVEAWDIEDLDPGQSMTSSSSSLLDAQYEEVHLLQIGVSGWSAETLERGHPIGLVLRETQRSAPAAPLGNEAQAGQSSPSIGPRCFARLGLFIVDSWLWGEALRAGDLDTAELPRRFFEGCEPETFEIF